MDQTINLLIGFDAMRHFLQARWEEEGRRSDDLANLLSSAERDVVWNSRPLDVAQWFDWLDAALCVRPEFDDVKSAIQQAKTDWAEFNRATEIASLPEREKVMDQLRTKEASQAWHRVGFRPMSNLDAFEAMRVFVAAYWERGHTTFSDVGAILTDLDRRDAPFHVALWNKWCVAVDRAQTQALQWDKS